MRVRVVGSGDAFGSGGRFQTCIAVTDDSGSRPRVLLDCGATSLTAMRQQQLDPNEIDTVLVSHLHGDHFGGVPFLVLDGQFRRRTRDLTVIGPPSTRSRLDQVMEAMFPGSSTAPRRFAVHVAEHVDGRAVELASLRVTPFEVRHASGAPAYALRVDGPSGSLAYSGDTEWTEALLPIARGADLFIVECYDYDRDLTGHMNWATIKRRLPDFNARRVMLTHMNPTMLAKVEDAKGAGVLVAEDGLTLDL